MIAHYDEEALIALLDSGAESDPHLGDCAECRESLDEFRTIASSLEDCAVWDAALINGEPSPQTIANLRAFADGQGSEDDAAISLVAELLAGSREEWMPRLLANNRYRTAGVVRKLMEASDKSLDVMPPDALQISALATEIVDKLDPRTYPSDTVMKLRGNAWRNRAYCLYYLGELHEASNAVSHSRALLNGCAISDHDLARTGIVSSLNERGLDDFESAITCAQESSRIFHSFGDVERFVSSSIAEAQSLLKVGRSRHALETLLRVLPNVHSISDDARARFFSNVAFCYRESGNVLSAIETFEIAANLFETREEGRAETLWLEWNVAVLLLNAGKADVAERRLLDLVGRFEARGMITEAILVRLDLAESYLVAGRLNELECLCRSALSYFSEVGLSYTARARTALAYLHEASHERRLTMTRLQHVRTYLKRLPTEPNLLFAPPPH